MQPVNGGRKRNNVLTLWFFCFLLAKLFFFFFLFYPDALWAGWASSNHSKYCCHLFKHSNIDAKVPEELDRLGKLDKSALKTIAVESGRWKSLGTGLDRWSRPFNKRAKSWIWSWVKAWERRRMWVLNSPGVGTVLYCGQCWEGDQTSFSDGTNIEPRCCVDYRDWRAGVYPKSQQLEIYLWR